MTAVHEQNATNLVCIDIIADCFQYLLFWIFLASANQFNRIFYRRVKNETAKLFK